MESQTYFEVGSYALAAFLLARGFECRGAKKASGTGRPMYLFDEAAASAIPAFRRIKTTLDYHAAIVSGISQ